MMPDRKHKRQQGSFIELDSEELGFVLEPTQIEVGSGYAISVSYDENEKQIVDVKPTEKLTSPSYEETLNGLFQTLKFDS